MSNFFPTDAKHKKIHFHNFIYFVEKVPPLDEEVLRIVAEVKKKRKSGPGGPRDDEAVLLDIMARISESYTKFRQVYIRFLFYYILVGPFILKWTGSLWGSSNITAGKNSDSFIEGKAIGMAVLRYCALQMFQSNAWLVKL